MSFLQRWKKGVKDLSPVYLAKVRLIGSAGTIIGILFASVFLALRGLGYFLIIMGFGLVIQLVDLANAYKNYCALKEFDVGVGDQQAVIDELMEEVDKEGG